MDFPINNGGSFHSYVKLPEGNHGYWLNFWNFIYPLSVREVASVVVHVRPLMSQFLVMRIVALIWKFPGNSTGVGNHYRPYTIHGWVMFNGKNLMTHDLHPPSSCVGLNGFLSILNTSHWEIEFFLQRASSTDGYCQGGILPRNSLDWQPSTRG